MERENNKGNNKQKLFFDADDVILNSSEVVISILNKEYGITPPKTTKDLKDWGYKSIYKGMTFEKITEIYSSEEFWSQVQLKEEFVSLLKDEELFNNYDWCIVSKGDKDNIDKKFNFLMEQE